MNWSDINIMDVIAGAIISAAGAIAVLALSIWGTGRKDRALVEKDTKINSQEHDKLSAEHNSMERRLSMEHQSIKDILAPIRENAKATHNIMLGEVARRETQYDNLSESQRDMKAQFENLQKMANQWEALVTENKELREQVRDLTKERDLAREQNRNLSNDKHMGRSRHL